jgi:hypothetical protein
MGICLLFYIKKAIALEEKEKLRRIPVKDAVF